MTLSQAEGQDLADKIRAWLRASGTGSPGPEVQEFIDDLENARNVSTWAGVNYERVLPMRVPRSRLVTILAIVRNVLVFVPIGLTWYALRDASTKFAVAAADLRAQTKAGQLNFLEFWQSLDGLSRLSSVALIDSLLIAALIVLSLYIGLAESLSQRARRLTEMHNGLMVSLEQKLSGYRYLSLADMNNLVHGTLQTLATSSRNVEVSAHSLAAAAQSAFSAISGVQQVTSTTFEPLVRQMDITVQSLGTAAKAHLDLGQLVTDNRTQLAAQLDATRQGLASIVQQVDLGSQTLIRGASSQLEAATKSIASAADTVSRDLAIKTSTELATVGGTVRDAVQDLKATFQEVGQGVEEAAERMRSTFATLEYGIQQVRDDLDSISRKLRSE